LTTECFFYNKFVSVVASYFKHIHYFFNQKYTKMIKQPKFGKLNNDAIFGFYTDVVKAIERHTDENLTPYTEPIQAMYLQLDAGYKLGRMNEITAEIKALDEQRDRALVGIRKVLEGYELYYQANKAEAAARLLYSLNKYGNITRLTYSEQSGALTSLLNEWKETTLKDNLELLGLKDWVEDLRLTQDKFALRYLDRAEDEATKKAVPISKLIPDAVKLYQEFALMLTAFAKINPTTFTPLANLLDELGKKYNEALRSETPKKKE
jgi:hypothetical protein